MSSSYTTRKRLLKQGTGDNANTWGANQSSGDFDVMDYAMDGWQTLAITGNHTLTSPNGTTTNNEAGARVLKLTTASSTYVQTLPAVEGWYLVWNATSAAQTVASAGGGTSLSVDSGAKVLAFTDGSAVYELGYAGLGLKAYIDSAIVATTGSLPATTGNNGKFLYCTAGAWTPTTFAAGNSDIWVGTAQDRAITPGGYANSAAEVTLTSSSNSVAIDLNSGEYFYHDLTENTTLANPTGGYPGKVFHIRVKQHASSAKTCTTGTNWYRLGGKLPVSTTLGSYNFYECRMVTSSYILFDLIANPTNT